MASVSSPLVYAELWPGGEAKTRLVLIGNGLDRKLIICQSDSSVQAFGDAMRRWQADAEEGHSAFHLIEISVASAHDQQAADALRDIPTGLRINADQLAAVRHFVRSEFAANANWQRLVKSLQPREAALALH